MHLPPTPQIATERSELGGNSPRSLFNLKEERAEKAKKREALPRRPPGRFSIPVGTHGRPPDISAHPTEDTDPLEKVGSQTDPPKTSKRPASGSGPHSPSVDRGAPKCPPRSPSRRDFPGVPAPGGPRPPPPRPPTPAAPTAAAPAATMGGSFSRSGSFPFLSSEAAAATAGGAPGDGSRAASLMSGRAAGARGGGGCGGGGRTAAVAGAAAAAAAAARGLWAAASHHRRRRRSAPGRRAAPRARMSARAPAPRRRRPPHLPPRPPPPSPRARARPRPAAGLRRPCARPARTLGRAPLPRGSPGAPGRGLASPARGPAEEAAPVGGVGGGKGGAGRRAAMLLASEPSPESRSWGPRGGASVGGSGPCGGPGTDFDPGFPST